MLRHLLGDETFWNAVQEYIATNLHLTVETDDFRKILEKHSKLNLTRFFDEWLKSPGYPKLKGSYSYDAEKKQVIVSMEQTQKDAKNGIGLFHFSLEIEIIDEQDNKYPLTLLFENGRGSVMTLVDSKPVELRVDPLNKVLFSLDFNPGNDLLSRTLRKGPTVIHRLWAAKELLNTGKRSSFLDVQSAMKEEPYYGVRAHVATLLGTSNLRLGREILVGMLQDDSNAIVQNYVTVQLKSMKDPIVEKALVAYLQKPDLPHEASSHALQGLGRQGSQHWDTLVKFTKDQSHLGRVRCGAYLGISNLRTEEAFNFLKDKTLLGTEELYVRPTLHEALAQVATWLDDRFKKEAIEILKEQLTIPDVGNPLTIFATIRGLSSLLS